MDRYDVVVVGGGPAGIGAALGASGNGAKVLLIERHRVLGGMGTSGLVNIFCNAHLDGKRSIIGGWFGKIRQELIRQGKLFTPQKKYNDGEPFDPDVYAHLLEHYCKQQDVDVAYNSLFQSVHFDNPYQATIQLSGGRQVLAKTVVDASGDASVAHQAGVSFTIGRDSDGAVMPWTYCFLAGPVDHEKAMQTLPDMVSTDENTGKGFIFILHQPWLKEMIHEAMANKQWDIPRDNGGIFSVPGRMHEVSVNLTRVFVKNPLDPQEFDSASELGKKQVHQCIQFFRNFLPGFENTQLVQMADQIGVRESRLIHGMYKLTKEDVLQRRQFEDVICQCCYGIDDHAPGSSTWGMDYFQDGEHYDIPFRSLVPLEGPPNLIVAGRCISSDRDAMSSYRAMPSCMGIGEAAGVAAALSAQLKIPMQEINPHDVQDILLKNDGILE